MTKESTLANLQDTRSARYYFWKRLYEYGANNFQVGFYYDKVHKKEYLPSRIRYNQFFLYAGILYFFLCMNKRKFMFVNEKEQDLGKRKFYTSARPIQNWFASWNDRSRIRSHVQNQKFTF